VPAYAQIVQAAFADDGYLPPTQAMTPGLELRKRPLEISTFLSTLLLPLQLCKVLVFPTSAFSNVTIRRVDFQVTSLGIEIIVNAASLLPPLSLQQNLIVFYLF